MSEAIARRDEGAIAVLTINRPEVRNAIDSAGIRLVGDLVRDIARDPSIRVVVITGSGDKAFSAGGDMAEMAENITALTTYELIDPWMESLLAIERSPKPVIAAVNGYAYGGGTELAMACHIRVASENAKFGQTEIALDHLPGGGGTQRLPRLIPLGAAYEYLLTGEAITAAEAHRLGLVNHVWPAEQLWERTMDLAGRIAARAPIAVRLSLEAIRDGLKGPLEVGLRLERALAGIASESEPAQQGLADFLNKKRKGET